MQHSLILQTIAEVRQPWLRWTIFLVGVAMLFALAHPLFMPAVRSSQHPGWAAVFAVSGSGDSALAVRLALPLLFAIFAAWFGAALVAREEERGSLGMLLAAPMTRRKIISVKFTALALLVLLPGLAVGLALVLLALLGQFPPDLLFIVRASLGLFLVGLVFGSLATALGSLSGKTNLSRVITLAAILLVFLLYLLPAARSISPLLLAFSPFHNYQQAVFAPAFFGPMLIMGLLAAAPFCLAWAAFEHRDLPI